MKKLIRWSLNHIPRPVLQRIAGWAVPAAGLLYKGRGVECPVCGAKYRKFMPYGYVQPRPNALCPKCLSLERHRLLWLYLTRETDLLTAFPRTLHIAPEVCIMRHLKPHFRPHPGLNFRGREEIAEQLLDRGAAGLEVFNNYHTPEQAAYFASLVRSEGALMTCGSDFHGKTKPRIAVGRFPSDSRFDGRLSDFVNHVDVIGGQGV